MGFVKVIKNKAYFKRYQVKFKRRRECKTDYYARQRLILQDKNKYNTNKYRFVVRFTNTDIVCQIFSSDLDHDNCIASAYAHELPRYGVKCGFTNYAAAYCTGLLLARRVNSKFKLNYDGEVRAELDTEEWGNEYFDGEFNMEDDEESGKNAFTALLDVGLARTTTGSRLFGALKGACDGGVDIPHSNRRFPGSSVDEEGELQVDNEVQRKYIFGGHVADYMRKLQENEEDYKRQFSRYIDAGVGADDLEKMYTDAHAAIRADPFKKRDPSRLGRFKTGDPKRSREKKSYKTARKGREDKADAIRQTLLEMGKKSVSVMDWKEDDEAPAEEKVEEKVEAEEEEDDDEDDDLL
eukprot:CAMPEP_0114513762 /NCGR_PEP_ID=MMETSP0109-20121206/15769_1 /TAXON_ID=29199 /ORGANISM="Chlorarachnion reptans, Strain CCCM449" /LENGTH=351 /DNA_ID=CAMNT_0001693709 /DNA_START=41 /DNA_END=1096 /DNA_ORIENTATION=+